MEKRGRHSRALRVRHSLALYGEAPAEPEVELNEDVVAALGGRKQARAMLEKMKEEMAQKRERQAALGDEDEPQRHKRRRPEDGEEEDVNLFAFDPAAEDEDDDDEDVMRERARELRIIAQEAEEEEKTQKKRPEKKGPSDASKLNRQYQKVMNLVAKRAKDGPGDDAPTV